MKPFYFYFVISTFATQITLAQSYDPTFNGNGFVTGPDTYAGVNQIEIPTDIIYDEGSGKLIMLNQFNGDGANLHRFNSNGSHDMDFGVDGVQGYDIDISDDYVNVLAHDGGYRLTGIVIPEADVYSPFNEDILENGLVNNAFGVDGIIIAESIEKFLPHASCHGNSGRYIIAGEDVVYANGAGLMCFNADGSFDNLFNYITLSINERTVFNSVLELPDERILAAGHTEDMFSPFNAFICCFLPDGSLDASFGDAGILYPEPDFEHGQFQISEMTLGSDGNIFAAGNLAAAPDYFIMAIKFNDEGILQPEFGDNGYVYLSGSIGFHVAQLEANTENQLYLLTENHYTTVYKLLNDGSLDSSFTNDLPGQFKINVPGTIEEDDIIGTDMLLQPDGKIVVLGYTDGLSGNDDFFITRIISNDTPVAITETTSKNIISIFPNPATDQINFECNEIIKTAEIISYDGRIVNTFRINNSINQLSIKDIPQGFYILKMELNNGNHLVAGFVKQ
ncbi:MAG: T9SS type A sorting domain-containing protein [Chitinophagales bacterium]|nr:T9SS type A sorting domain-containing protein [Chitinophagales bacterium]MBP9550195.1 T9SS type A sorting domain-containing protein [Chitinophagales bacterium]